MFDDALLGGVNIENFQDILGTNATLTPALRLRVDEAPRPGGSPDAGVDQTGGEAGEIVDCDPVALRGEAAEDIKVIAIYCEDAQIIIGKWIEDGSDRDGPAELGCTAAPLGGGETAYSCVGQGDQQVSFRLT